MVATGVFHVTATRPDLTRTLRIEELGGSRRTDDSAGKKHLAIREEYRCALVWTRHIQILQIFPTGHGFREINHFRSLLRRWRVAGCNQDSRFVVGRT